MCLHGTRRGNTSNQRSSLAVSLDTRDTRFIHIVKRMHENIEDPLELHKLAQETGTSPRHIQRLFKEHVGRSPNSVYLDVRLDHGRRILSETCMTISQVAVACGFASLRHFIRAYIARFGQTPGRTKATFEAYIP